MSYDVSKLNNDSRDGLGFELIAHLNGSISRGSILAVKQKQAIENFDLDIAQEYDLQVRRHLTSVREEMIDAFAEMDDDFDWEPIVDLLFDNDMNDYFTDFDLIPNNLLPETVMYFFSELLNSKNEKEIGPFGKIYSDEEHGYNIAHYPAAMVLSPLIPRNFLWDISILGPDTVADRLQFRSTFGFPFLTGIPDYLISICFSPAASSNLLKKVFEDGRAGWHVDLWIQAALLINPVSDIWLLSQFDPGLLSNSLLDSGSGFDDMSTSAEELSFGVLNLLKVWNEINSDSDDTGPLDGVFDTIKAIFEFSQDQGLDKETFVTLILVLRIIKEFKDQRADWKNFINSESNAIKLAIYCNPDIDEASRNHLQSGELSIDNPEIINLVRNFWLKDDYVIFC